MYNAVVCIYVALYSSLYVYACTGPTGMYVT